MNHHQRSYAPGPTLWLEPSAPPCTKCGGKVALTRIEPYQPGFDLRCFECPKCYHVDQYSVEYATTEPWVLLAQVSE